VALGEAGELRALAAGRLPRGGSQELPGLYLEVLASGPPPDALAVLVGPGSFTGIKVGIAFARGLARALGLPLAGVDGLEALALAAGPGEHLVAVDALRGELFGGRFQVGRGPWPEALGPAQLGPASGLAGAVMEAEAPGAPSPPGGPRIASRAVLAAGLRLVAAGRILPVVPLFTRRSWAECP
jgi:tRNA threonylcarbamoyladenosine biosynthesis protein TsaB